jgi:ubiquinone/menaquinone biosynthesis C-methylase UbiE
MDVRRNTEEKAKYGWYVKNLIIGFFIIGFTGLGFFVLGFFFQGWIAFLLFFIGIILIILFLWPGIGFLVLNLSLGEDSIVAKKISAIKDIFPKEYLDVGCGTGRTTMKIAKILPISAHLTGIDIFNTNAISGNALQTVQNNARIEGVANKTTFQVGSATNIPFEDNKFDVINESFVLREIHKSNCKKKAINEIYRVLKPNGYLFVVERDRKAIRTIALLGIFCFVFKSKAYWHNLLEQNGFKGIIYEPSDGFGIFTAKKL